MLRGRGAGGWQGDAVAGWGANDSGSVVRPGVWPRRGLTLVAPSSPHPQLRPVCPVCRLHLPRSPNGQNAKDVPTTESSPHAGAPPGEHLHHELSVSYLVPPVRGDSRVFRVVVLSFLMSWRMWPVRWRAARPARSSTRLMSRSGSGSPGGCRPVCDSFACLKAQMKWFAVGDHRGKAVPECPLAAGRCARGTPKWRREPPADALSKQGRAGGVPVKAPPPVDRRVVVGGHGSGYPHRSSGKGCERPSRPRGHVEKASPSDCGPPSNA